MRRRRLPETRSWTTSMIQQHQTGSSLKLDRFPPPSVTRAPKYGASWALARVPDSQNWITPGSEMIKDDEALKRRNSKNTDQSTSRTAHESRISMGWSGCPLSRIQSRRGERVVECRVHSLLLPRDHCHCHCHGVDAPEWWTPESRLSSCGGN